MDELKVIIRSLAISSASGMTLSQLDHDFKSLEGYSIPYKTHGFKSLFSMLRTLTDVVQVKGNDQQSTIHPVTTEKNQHIRSLVEKSKKSKKKTINFYSRSKSSSHEPKSQKASSNTKQRYNSKSSNATQHYYTKSSNASQRYYNNNTNVNRNAWRTKERNISSQNNYYNADYQFDQFMKTLRVLPATTQQNGQYYWNGGNVNNGTPNNVYYPTANMRYHNNQQYYENNMQNSFNAWSCNNSGWNYNQAAPQQRNMNNFPSNNWNWNGYYPPNWVGNNMFFNNPMGFNNNGGGYSNQFNCGMANNMNFGYNNNYPPYACNNGFNNYDSSYWYSSYAQHYSQ